MEIISRDAAIAAGLKRYFTGKPCRKGHVCERQVHQHRCVECVKLKNQANYSADPERHRFSAAARRAKRPERHKAQQAEYRAKNRQVLRSRSASWRAKNPELLRESQRAYYQRNRRSRIDDAVARERARLQSDPLFAFKKQVRCLVRDAAARGGFAKATKTASILGCSWPEFAAHIERQFLPGMTWANRGEWHIDHIVALATAKTEADALALNHFTNLRPMWGLDNIKKGAKQTHLI